MPSDNSSDPRELLCGNDLKRAVYQLAESIRDRSAARQSGANTFFENAVSRTLQHLLQLDQTRSWEESVEPIEGDAGRLIRVALNWLREHVTYRDNSRYVSFRDRLRAYAGGAPARQVDPWYFCMSQGVHDCMQWKGMPLFKTVFDSNIYSKLIFELQPKTIFEIGSGSGASAIWMGDLLESYALPAKIYSMDLTPPTLIHPRVEFVFGDSRQIEAAFDAVCLAHAPHPWLLIEDAHVNVVGVLDFFHPHLARDDYVIVEDSAEKRDELLRFFEQKDGLYEVDTHYTDFFGRNVTCAVDSIFVRR